MNRPDPRDPLLHAFANDRDMFRALADEVVARLKAGVAARGSASLVCSGGTTPGALYDDLSQREAPWEHVFVTLSDERWVPPTSDASNEKLVRTRLIRNRASSARLVPMKTPDADPHAAEEPVSRALAAMPHPFAVTLLGMGNDGHTASMFPESDGLEAALDISSPLLVRAVRPRDFAKTGERMSLTLRAILDSQLIVILVKGQSKLDTYHSALAGEDVRAMPVRAVLRQSKTPVQVYWAPSERE